MSGLKAKRVTLRQLHAFIMEREGETAAHRWLVAHVSNQHDEIAVLKKQISILKGRITRNENKSKSNTPHRLRPGAKV